MNKYTELSDFEINKKVAEKLGLNFKDGVIVKNGEWFYFDPCNNPADAMPIIIENKISIIHKKNDGTWYAYQPFKSVEHENFYRAAMELFLLMKDAENEG